MRKNGGRNHRPHRNGLHADGVIETDRAMATAAALDASAFGAQAVGDAIPKTWEERAAKAWQYYVEEPIVQNAINSWRTFAIGDEIQFNCDDEEVKWEVREFADRAGIQLNTLVKDSVLQCLVKGETVCYKRYAKDGGDIEEAVCVNPVSMTLRHENGKLVEAKQRTNEDGTGEALDLPVEQTLHIKWNAPSYSARGNSMVVTAFESIELLRDYRRAERAVAKRWTTPLRFIQVGGQFGQKTIIPDQKTLNGVRDMVNKMDLKAGLVVPFYIKAETYGTEGQVLDTEKKIKEIKEDIIIALGLAKSLITGDGPNFATAAIGMQKMVIMLKEIKQVARNILNWIVLDWQKLHGYEEKSVNYIFNDLDLTNEVDIKKLYIELFDRKLISRNSLQIKMDLNPEVETSHTETESKQPIDVTDPKVIIDMVNAGIMSVEVAQGRLGLDLERNRPADGGEWIGSAPSAVGAPLPNEVCDGCAFFEEAENFCQADRRPTRFDARACRFFEAKRGAAGA